MNHTVTLAAVVAEYMQAPKLKGMIRPKVQQMTILVSAEKERQ